MIGERQLPPDECEVLDDSLPAAYIGNPLWLGVAWLPLDRGHPYWVDREAAERDRRAEARERAEARYVASLPPRYRDCTLTTLRVHAGNQAAVSAATRLEPGQSLYVWGPAGNGKTHLAVATGRRLAAEGLTVAFHGVVELFARLRASFGPGGGAAPDLETPAVLILDDLGKLKPTEFAYEVVYGALEYRWSHLLTTVFTANHRPSVAAARLGADAESAAAVLSRMAAGAVVEVRGPDGRMASP